MENHIGNDMVSHMVLLKTQNKNASKIALSHNPELTEEKLRS